MDAEIRKLQEERSSGRVGLGSKSGFDSDIYGNGGEDEYEQSEVSMEDHLDNTSSSSSSHPSSSSRTRINASKEQLGNSIGRDDETDYRAQYGSGLVNTRISDRETDVSELFIYFISFLN